MESSYLPINTLQEALEVCDGGGVRWKIRPIDHFNNIRGMSVFNGRYAGCIAGAYLSPLNQYRIVWITYLGVKYQILEHIVVFALYNGRYPQVGMMLDHIDGNGLNNSIENLREVTRSDNMHNKKMYSRNTSGHVGVRWYKKYECWVAAGTHQGKPKTIGYFENIEDAIQARKEWEIGKGFTERHGSYSEKGEPLE